MSKAIWPNFFIIGEPRSGTSSLHKWLAQHPDIFMSVVKEPHYFSRAEFPPPEDEILQITRDRAAYLNLFADSQNFLGRGESSTYYLADPAAPRLIHQAVPNAKLIAVLRDPVQRAYSHYLLYDRRGPQTLNFRQTIERQLAGQEPRLVYDLVELGRYHKHLANYYKYFKPEQIMVVMFDDLTKRPAETLHRICQFLEVDTAAVQQIDTGQTSNGYARPRGHVSRKILANQSLTNSLLKYMPRLLVRHVRNNWLLQSAKKPPLDPVAQKLLVQAYAPEIAQLEQLLGQKLPSLRQQRH
jgi:hypothetical protein